MDKSPGMPLEATTGPTVALQGVAAERHGACPVLSEMRPA